jgi:hypothetical protein
MQFEMGELVAGCKPWNKNTKLGVIIEKATPQAHSRDRSAYRVFWVSDPGSEKSTFITWEVVGSLVKLPGEKNT